MIVQCKKKLRLDQVMNDKKSCENDWQEGKSSRECQEYMLEKQVSDSTHCKNLSLKISREIDDTCSSGVDFFGCFSRLN